MVPKIPDGMDNDTIGLATKNYERMFGRRYISQDQNSSTDNVTIVDYMDTSSGTAQNTNALTAKPIAVAPHQDAQSICLHHQPKPDE